MLLVWALVIWAAAGCTTPTAFAGPLPVRNQHPAQLLVQSMPPRRAAVQEAGAVAARGEAAYTNLFLFGNHNGDQFVMDGEYLRAALAADVGLGGGFEFGIEVPVAHTSGGFLDDFVIGYHDLFGFPDQARSTNPKDVWEIEATRGGQTVWQVQSEAFELLDIPLTLTWSPCASGPPGAAPTPGFAWALRAGIELPTGNDERGYGSGQLDTTFGAVFEQRFEQAAVYGHLQHTFAGTPAPARREGFSFRDVSAAGIGVELPWAVDFAALVQLGFETSTLRELDLREANQDQLLLWVGGRWQVASAWSLEFAFGEDLIGHVSPDFTAWIGATWLPGR
ncbi:MAG: DUF3187 family protein [Planctomycetes bacterium]|nr:DUF3187 family protein [Planctomycetota bacterium]MCB9887187.1 DUF3187 family protein [Planctomycetota bacterium]